MSEPMSLETRLNLSQIFVKQINENCRQPLESLFKQPSPPLYGTESSAPSAPMTILSSECLEQFPPVISLLPCGSLALIDLPRPPSENNFWWKGNGIWRRCIDTVLSSGIT